MIDELDCLFEWKKNKPMNAFEMQMKTIGLFR